jgi:hypothetical protein
VDRRAGAGRLELIADVNRHPEWWPRVVAVRCEELEEGCSYREVVQSSVSQEEMELEAMRDAALDRAKLRSVEYQRPPQLRLERTGVRVGPTSRTHDAERVWTRAGWQTRSL